MFYIVCPGDPPIIIDCCSTYEEAKKELEEYLDYLYMCFIATEKQLIDIGVLLKSE